MTASVAILWNPSAGSTETARELKAHLRRQPGFAIHQPDSREATIEVARQAAAQGWELVVAAGGDGTINAVVTGLMQARESGRQTSFAVLPLGTANDFAGTLGLPDDPAAAAELLARSPRPLDVIRVSTPDQTMFGINVATGGNAQRVTELMTAEIKQTWGPFSYLRGAIEVLTDLEVFSMQATFDDGAPEVFTALNVIVGNGRSSGGRMAVAPQANPEDGLLDVVIVLDGPAIDLVSLGANFLLSDYLEHANVVFRRARRLRIEASPAIAFSIDGEPCGSSPLEFEVLPQVLPTVVGPEFLAHFGDKS